MKVTIIGMPGCGNLGDDLISQLLVKKICAEYKPSEIGVICGDHFKSNDYSIENDVKLIPLKKPRKRSFEQFFTRKRIINKFISQSELIFIGGGGLLQDTHSIFTIHNYLRFIRCATKAIIFVGIGVGPINHYLNRLYLKKILNIDNIYIQVRDKESRDVLKSIGIEKTIHLGPDIVEGSPVISFEPKEQKNNSILGINIRKWPDLETSKLVDIIKDIIKDKNIDTIKFFIFENTIDNNIEKDFSAFIAKRIQEKTKVKTYTFVYNEISNKKFFSEFYNIDYAISSRYHANILWQKANIPTLPIVYSPKVSSLYKKYNKQAHTFTEIVKSNMTVFLEINNLQNYKLPQTEAVKINISTGVKIFICTISIVEFIYSISRSLLLLLNKRLNALCIKQDF
ncbi:polysaccharide pyruvyl transferase family protein [Sunxiuqinia elliptica]|uniref:Polysaccharide pyruvyl transferase WcaK-like protein n=1 Tax=Sunxiuqinia elliptica TaxID=655355 RepID=A0A4R6GS78_9BACT|nr:polysaccharide pyruvyl transferase family protein [Sunxiuqinia elliptica]TDN98221.1 polysaccharide pyruvyl transferase WcaK-like protein [Sunxiuqinia elliptica]TDO60328.1 polysaccharide pyruvyl transferase WcaK-like protein [Sunxiuqinia elliptica]